MPVIAACCDDRQRVWRAWRCGRHDHNLSKVYIIKPIFSKGSPLTVRLVFFALLSIFCMLVDAHGSWLQSLRSHAGIILTPIYWAGDLPGRSLDAVSQLLTSRSDILAENERLRADTLLMQRRMQKLATLTEQNVRLRELLNSSALLEEQVLVAELLGVDPNVQTHKLLINKGSRHGVYQGQPVLDARGVMGQVVEVMPFSARVLLLTDNSHSLPVQVTRNGLRAIGGGIGQPGMIELRYVADNADIKEGDLLVTSGMAQRFPAGYPVGVVTRVERATGQPFAMVHAAPAAALDRSRHFLLVFAEGHSPQAGSADARDEMAVEAENEARATEGPEGQL